MSILHTVNKSPFEKSSLDSCLGTIKSGSSILLIEDGVYAVIRGTVLEPKIRAALESFTVYCLEPDLLARGLEREACIEGVGLVSYEGFVDLAVEHDAVQAWL